MKTRLYARRLRRYLWIPALLTATALIGAAVAVLRSPPEYRAAATVVAKSPSNGFEKTLNFADIATSNTVTSRVRKQLGESETVDQLRGRVDVSSRRSNLYTITVRDSDPQRAVRIANAFARNGAALYEELGSGTGSTALTELEKQRAFYQQQYLVAATALADFNRTHPAAVNPTDSPLFDWNLGPQALELQLDERVTADAYLKYEDQVTQARIDQANGRRDFQAVVIDDAVASPDQLRSLLKVVYTVGLALVLSSAIVLFVEYRDRSVRDVREVEQMLETPVIATIPRARPRTVGRASVG